MTDPASQSPPCGDESPGPNRTEAPPDQPARRSRDPWAHRRAEPRTFAFIWTVYLFAATVSVYAVTVTSGVGGYDAIRPAARMLLVLIAAGMFIVWPLVRVSQEPDQRPLVGPVLDLIVVLVPIQAIVWPQYAWWLTGWPFGVVAATAAVLAAWAVVVASIVSMSHQARAARQVSAPWCMLIVMGLLVLCHVPMAAQAAFASASGATGERGELIRPLWMLSPIGGVLELTRDTSWSGQPARATPGHWRMIGLLGGVGLALWLGAVAARFRVGRAAA